MNCCSPNPQSLRNATAFQLWEPKVQEETLRGTCQGSGLETDHARPGTGVLGQPTISQSSASQGTEAGQEGGGGAGLTRH